MNRATHQLDTTEGGNFQDLERLRPTERYSRTRNMRGRPVRTRKKWPSQGHSRTEPQIEGLVRPYTESDRACRTHSLGNKDEAPVSTRTESNRTRCTHSLGTAGARTYQDRGRRVIKSAPTSWRPQKGELVRTRKKCDRAKGAHSLEAAEEPVRTRKKATGRSDSLPGDRRVREMSGHEKRATGKEVLTSWGPQGEGLVRTWK